ncbi:arginine repressor [Spirochaeta lutea]|uniref:Arginine repressor n=1 Tax=Spirochaeta lutea TaxID=1480694 RepID=A0A098R001_9SPIO|nr:ArgR family transcriptional regulator [Spirochaeta lutea]KGE73460.1 ArgR family transcriptional regulator [Spirochaeta lutea]
MKERTLRLKAIKRIIRGTRINSQENLLHHLQREGFSVTQATLSRDLKLLKVGKISEGLDGYYYTLPSEEERRESERSYLQDVHRGYVGIDFSANIGVIRTLAGHANSVAIALDNLGLEEILGTIAGDDTVLIILREGFTKVDFLQELRRKIPDLEE